MTETGGRPRLSGVLETSLYVSDLDRAERFYERVFGCETFLADDRMRAMGVAPNQVLLLFRLGGSAQPSPGPGDAFIPAHDGHGTQHLCFAIPTGAEENWAAHFARLDVAVESRVAWPRGGISLYVRDPDRHSIEVATPGLWPNY